MYANLKDTVESAHVTVRLETGQWRDSNYFYLEVLDVFGVTDSPFFSDIIIHTNITLMYNINPAE